MHALVSLLPEPYYRQVELLWDELETNFGLRSIRVTPHFSWQVSETYAEHSIIPTIEKLALETKPFEVHVKAIEAFFSPNPVVFLKILRDTHLTLLHTKIWLKLLPISNSPNFLYSPILWRPHISLAYQDLTKEVLKEVIAFLKAKNIDWKFTVDNLALVCQAGDEVGKLRSTFTLLGK